MAGKFRGPSGPRTPAKPVGDEGAHMRVSAPMAAGAGLRNRMPERTIDPDSVYPTADAFQINRGDFDDAPVWEPYPGERWRTT